MSWYKKAQAITPIQRVFRSTPMPTRVEYPGKDKRKNNICQYYMKTINSIVANSSAEDIESILRANFIDFTNTGKVCDCIRNNRDKLPEIVQDFFNKTCTEIDAYASKRRDWHKKETQD